MRLPEFLESKWFNDAASFLLFFAAFFLALNLLFALFVPLQMLEEFVAGQVLFVLKANNVQGAVSAQEPVLLTLATGHLISISYLCTGFLETAVLAAAILASHGISWRRRILGVLLGAFFAHAFNVGRIVVTVFSALEQPLHVVELTHDVLFRVTLFAVVFAMYAVWFALATGKANFIRRNT